MRRTVLSPPRPVISPNHMWLWCIIIVLFNVSILLCTWRDFIGRFGVELGSLYESVQLNLDILFVFSLSLSHTHTNIHAFVPCSAAGRLAYSCSIGNTHLLPLHLSLTHIFWLRAVPSALHTHVKTHILPSALGADVSRSSLFTALYTDIVFLKIAVG